MFINLDDVVDTKDSCDVAIEHYVSGKTDSALSM